MSTIDMSKVAGFKAVDSEGNEMGIVSMNDIVDAVKSSINQQGLVAARQISTLAATSTLADTSTLAATDSYEDQLPQKTDVTWVRGLDADGNPILISKQSLSSVLEGLLGSPLKGTTKYTFVGGMYNDRGYYVEICTIGKKADTAYESIELFIHNNFYDSQHGGFAHLYIGISNSIVPKLASLVSYPVSNYFEIYTYFDGELLHIYAKTNGGNGVGRFSLFIGRTINNQRVTFIGSQMTELPSEATKL